MIIISDIEWREFINFNIASSDVVEVIAMRIKYCHELTDREMAIYNEHSDKIEKKIKSYK